MKRISVLAIMAIMAMALAGCRREDWREVTLDVPGLTEAGRKSVESALSQYRGVDTTSLKFDFASRTVKVRYDSMQVAQTNLRMAIEEKGIAVTFPTNTTGFAGYIDGRAQ